MGLFNALNTGITGLASNGLALSVIGDNISHLNTNGFKGSTAQFQDLIVQKLDGGKGTLGLGSATGKIRQSFAQGALEGSTRNGDVAIDGKGFFVVSNTEGVDFYSRAGQFQMTTEGNLIDLVGNRLQGYGVTTPGGPLNTAVGDLSIPADPIPGTATTEITLAANLQGDPSRVIFSTPTVVVPGTTTFADISTDADFTSSMTVNDSLGGTHDVTVAFYETAAGTWTYSAFVDGAETGGTADEPVQIGTGTLAFTTNGQLDPLLSTINSAAVTFTGASAQTIAFDFGQTAADSGSMTQFSTGGFAVTDVQQNGNGSGALVDFSIGQDGLVSGIYNNGETRTLGQVVLATFRAEGELDRIGNNLYRATTLSGEAAVGTPGGGGRGRTQAFAVEMSNVDLETEFVRMIKSQKGYQAGARVVSGADDMLQELMQLG
jgi:flagellar hook protein FlgE